MKKIIPIFLAVCCSAPLYAAQPRLVVQLVVGSMRAEDLDRYAANWSDGGFARLMQDGTRYTDARYDFQQTSTPVTLSTLSTGALPSTHGVISERWQDYTSNRTVELTAGPKGPGAYHLIAPTLSETLLRHVPGSRAVTVAAEPTAAVMLAGRSKEAFWIDPLTAGWTTSPYYAAELPEWIARNNRERYNLSYLTSAWYPLYDAGRYLNAPQRDGAPESKSKKEKRQNALGRLDADSDYERLMHTPAGNTAVLGLAKQAIAQYGLGADATPDLLNISLDAARRITERYGPESVEAEDMYYRLDRDLKDFLTFLFAQVRGGEVLVVFTSDHGTSPSWDAGAEAGDRFNARQFEVIVNGFLNVRYGTGDWVLDYADKSLWLNHNLIYERGLDLADVQNEVAVFAMQFGGVSHALSATAMRSSYFGSGYARRMQNSFYPRRSGDVVLNLMPGWIVQDERRSSSGSLYGYDTQVPLIFCGTGAGPAQVRRRVEMTSVAPTLARLMEFSEPAASEGEVLPEIVDL